MTVPDFQRQFPKEEVQVALIDFLRDRRLLHPWCVSSEFERIQLVPGTDGSVFLSLWRKR